MLVRQVDHLGIFLRSPSGRKSFKSLNTIIINAKKAMRFTRNEHRSRSLRTRGRKSVFNIFAEKYQQAPVQRHSIMIKREVHMPLLHEPPRPTSSSFVLQSWDAAAKDGELNDYSACATLLFHEGKIYVAHMLQDRFEYVDLIPRAIAHARMHRPKIILVEDIGIGIALLGQLKKAGWPAQPAVKLPYD